MSSILFQIENNVAYITLNRPDKLNSFNREMALAMQAALDECKNNSDVRALAITGAGKGFCAGQDLAEVVDPNGPGMNRILSEHYNPIIQRIYDLPKPVLAVVNGVAAGAGANIALCCDIVIAAASSSFIQAFSKIGLIPDSGGTFTLPRLIGWQKASALMMLGDKVTAQEALQMGMIYKVVEDEALVDQSKKLSVQLAQMPTQALGYIKAALHASANNDMQTQLALEDTLQQKAAATEDFKEGVSAFLEKRVPVYKGK
jgi:2-(1,2-epoxy-1,2-dihydrophenyl)acetyl-CoA isomerase